MDKKDLISPGQLMAAVWAASLALAVGILPGAVAAQSGGAGWLAAVAAVPGLLGAGWLMYRVTESGRLGLARACRSALGRGVGGAVLIIYILSGVLLGGVQLRLSARRLIFTARSGGGLWFFLLVIAAMAVWLVWRRLAPFARTAVLLYRGVLACLVVILALTLPQIRPENILPIWTQDAVPVAGSGVQVVGVLCCGLYGAFVLDGVRPGKGLAAGWVVRTVALSILLGVLLVAVLGTQGAPLTARLSDPFVTLSKHVGVEGAFQRVESLVGAVWLLADLVLLGLILCGGRAILAELCPGLDDRLSVCLMAGAILAVAGLVFAEGASAGRFAARWVSAGGLVLFIGLPGAMLLVRRVAYLVSKTREKRQI